MSNGPMNNDNININNNNKDTIKSERYYNDL